MKIKLCIFVIISLCIFSCNNETQHLREEITQLTSENSALKRENNRLNEIVENFKALAKSNNVNQQQTITDFAYTATTTKYVFVVMECKRVSRTPNIYTNPISHKSEIVYDEATAYFNIVSDVQTVYRFSDDDKYILMDKFESDCRRREMLSNNGSIISRYCKIFSSYSEASKGREGFIK